MVVKVVAHGGVEVAYGDVAVAAHGGVTVAYGDMALTHGDMAVAHGDGTDRQHTMVWHMAQAAARRAVLRLDDEAFHVAQPGRPMPTNAFAPTSANFRNKHAQSRWLSETKAGD